VVSIRVPRKKQLEAQLFWPGLLQFWFWPGCANALRPATANDTPAPTIIFEAARKLRRDLISVLPEDISVTSLSKWPRQENKVCMNASKNQALFESLIVQCNINYPCPVKFVLLGNP
jgi:hypothetical protein